MKGLGNVVLVYFHVLCGRKLFLYMRHMKQFIVEQIVSGSVK
jgi:hypothetical protein